MDNNLKIKKLIYRSKHRGCKETDILLGEFADSELEKLSPQEIDIYADFIEEDDWDIYNWLNNNLVMPEKYADNIAKKIIEFRQNAFTK